MSSKVRTISSVLSATMPPEDRKAILAYYAAMLRERDAGSVEGRRIAFAMQRGEVVDIPERYWTNVCCPSPLEGRREGTG